MSSSSPIKRSVLFGLIGTLWGVLFIALNFAISLTYFSSLHDQAWHVWDYRFIAAAWYIFEAFGMDAVVLISSLLCLWVWIRLLRRFNFPAAVRGYYLKRIRKWKAGQGGIAVILLKVVVLGAAVYGASTLADYGTAFLGLGDPIPYYSLGFVKGLFVWTMIEAGPVVPITFTLFSLAHALFTYGRISLLPRRLLVPFAGLACFFAALLAGNVTAERLDTYKTIQNVPGITRETNPVALLVLGKNAPPLLLDRPFPSLLLTSPLFGDEAPMAVSYCAANEDALCRYIEGRTVPTVQGLTAYDFIISSRLRQLDIPGVIDACASAWEDTGEQVYWHLCVNYITNGCRSDARRDILHSITDSSRYVIMGRSAMKLAPAFALYGEMFEARYWFKKGVRTAASYNPKDRAVFRPPDSPPFSDGKIQGRVSIPGVGIGIMRKSGYEAYTMIRKETDRPSFLLLSIMDGMKAGPDGSFAFSGLPAGEYVLVLSLPGKEEYTVRNMPGVITVSEEKPVADVGTIELVEQNMTRTPNATNPP